jgi:ribose 5-phosphate isomerase A
MNAIENAKKLAAYAAVDQHILNGFQGIVGIGSGSTVYYAVERLKQKASSCSIVACVPTSFQAQELILNASLPLVKIFFL